MHPNWRDILVAGCIVFPNQVIAMAITCGHIVMVYLALQLCSNHIQEAMNTASYGVTLTLCKCGTTMTTTSDLDEAMEWAAEGGHEEVVRSNRELGASKFDSAILWAASSGHGNIMRLFCDWSVIEFELPMVWTANNGCENTMRLCYEWEAADLDKVMAWAVSGGHESTVRLCYDWSAQESDLAMAFAT